MKTIRYIVIAVLIAVALASCSKEDATSRMNVMMTDAPAELDAVVVYVHQVRVHHSGNDEVDGEGWIDLETNAGYYDLLTLQNGVTTMLAEDVEIPSGSLQQMRLVLLDSNYVMSGGVEHHLEIPSGEQTGLKFNLNTDLDPDKTYEVLIDFDAGASVKEENDGSFKLQPVIKVVHVNEI